MKNYLEHETEVKFIDGILSKNQEWQWFIDCIESDFELTDINNYDEFKIKNTPLRRILGNFIKIIEISDKDWMFTYSVLRDLFEIARFITGILSIDECKKNTVTNMGKVLLAIVWLTKIENSDNNTDYIVDMRFLSQNNFFQAIEMSSFSAEEDEIMEYIDLIDIAGFERAKKCIKDNLLRVPYGVTDGFLEKYRDNLLSANAFNYQNVQRDDFLTWQENTLLDMLSVSIKKRTITPTFAIGNSIIPNYTLWTRKVINEIKEFFDDAAVTFVAESIDYIKNGVNPEKTVVDTHCKMLKELIDDGNDYNVLSSSTYTIIASLFSDGSIKKYEKKGNILELIKCIQNIESITLLLKLKEDGFPLSKEQNVVIKNYVVEQYKSIEGIHDIQALLEYLRNRDIAKNINQTYYNTLKLRFIESLSNPRQQLIPSLFYNAMLFLIDLNQTNRQVNKRNVKEDMISLQESWQNVFYLEQRNNLQEFSFSTKIPSNEIEVFNNVILEKPILMAQKCLISKPEDMINAMIIMSEHPLIYMVNKMLLSPVFPLDGATVNYGNHEIDSLLRNQVDAIKEKYGYKFLNVLETEKYVLGLHERYRENAVITIPMFKEEKKLYHLLEKKLDNKLIPYDTEIKLGHLTQLFPLLEIQIRKLGKMFGIVPFKEKATEFMKFKDPSSVLRELLEDVYKELGSFENVPDLLFVYHFMYNGNSMNIRNECIHGRDYCHGNQLRYGFKVTLLALHMINTFPTSETISTMA